MKAALVGCGYIAETHLHVLQRLSGIDVVGVCDRDVERAATLSCAHRSTRAFADLEEMLQRTRPDVVHVLTPPHTHRDIAIQAMRAGCHVLVEKPMAMTTAEAREMADVSQRRGIVLGVVHNFRFVPAFRRAWALVDAGKLGRVRSVDVFWRVTSYAPQRDQSSAWIDALPGGIFHEVAPHLIYLALAVAPELQLLSVSVGHNDNRPDELRALFHSNIGPVTLGISVAASPVQKFVRLYGTDMSLHVDLATSVLTRLRGRADGMIPRALLNLEVASQLAYGTVANAVRSCIGRLPRGHETLIREFYAGLSQGTPPSAGYEEGVAVVAVLDQLWNLL